MAWQINKAGSRAGVLKSIAEAKSTPPGDPQLETAKAYLTAEINSVAHKFNGVRVVASGSTEGGRQSQFNVIPMELEL